MPRGTISVVEASEASGFLGSWLVSESVYQADGTHLGFVQQHRALTQLSDTRLRVVQSCSPQPTLAHHPMGAFKGEWVFDLEMDGQDRHYLGPDVVGGGKVFGGSIILGRGLWPKFGHSFRSFAILGTSERQLTGGSFSQASHPTAHIMGLAVAESSSAHFPSFDGPWWPGSYSSNWEGTRIITDASGHTLDSYPVEREYPQTDDGGWLGYTESGGGLERHAQFNFTNRQTRIIDHNAETTHEYQGFSVRYGHMWNTEVVGDDNTISVWRHTVDCISGTAVDIRSIYHHETLARVDITTLSPVGEATLEH